MKNVGLTPHPKKSNLKKMKNLCLTPRPTAAVCLPATTGLPGAELGRDISAKVEFCIFCVSVVQCIERMMNDDSDMVCTVVSLFGKKCRDLRASVSLKKHAAHRQGYQFDL